MDFKKAVENIVIEGKTALGENADFGHIQFPKKDTQALSALTKAARTLATDIGASMEHDGRLTSLIIKLANHMSKHSQDMMGSFEKIRIPLRDEIQSKPHVLDSKKTINAIVKEHGQKSRQAAARLREELLQNPPETPPEILKAGAHTLHELVSPTHLKEETAILGHCTGENYNSELLEEHGLEEGDPGADEYLTYMVKIRNKAMRIFSLRDEAGIPVATLSYDIKTKSINQIEGSQLNGNSKTVSAEDPFFSDLCEAIFSLKEQIDIQGEIKGFPALKDNNLILKTGKIIPYDYELIRTSPEVSATMEQDKPTTSGNNIKPDRPNIDLEEVLVGNIKLNEGMSTQEVQTLCAHTGMKLTIPTCPNEWLNENLPEEIKAQITLDTDQPIALDKVRIARNIYATHAKSFKANALKHAGYILANEASHFEANALETATEIRAYSSEYFETNALKTIEGLHVDGVQTFKAKSLKTALEVILSDAISVDLRSLQKGYVQFEGNKLEQIILCHGSEDLMFSTVNLNDFIRQENEDGSITCINPDSLDPNAHLEIDDPSPF